MVDEYICRGQGIVFFIKCSNNQGEGTQTKQKEPPMLHDGEKMHNAFGELKLGTERFFSIPD